jgi:tetratricopeptide (TPR) repeat protein
MLGQADEAHRWYKLALDSFDRMLAAGGQRAERLNSRAFCAAKLGRYDEALGNVQEARKLKPKQSSFLFRAAQICAMAGRREEVYSWTRQAIQAGFSREEFHRDPAFRGFQDDLRFRTILESATR